MKFGAYFLENTSNGLCKATWRQDGQQHQAIFCLEHIIETYLHSNQTKNQVQQLHLLLLHAKFLFNLYDNDIEKFLDHPHACYLLNNLEMHQIIPGEIMEDEALHLWTAQQFVLAFNKVFNIQLTEQQILEN